MATTGKYNTQHGRRHRRENDGDLGTAFNGKVPNNKNKDWRKSWRQQEHACFYLHLLPGQLDS